MTDAKGKRDLAEYIGRRATIIDSGSAKKWVIGEVCHPDGNYVKLVDEKGMVRTPIHFARLELVPLPHNSRKDYPQIDGFGVSHDEATEWFAFLMLQAGTMFANIPEGSWEEIERIMEVRGTSPSGPIIRAAKAYVEAAEEWYKEDEAND